MSVARGMFKVERVPEQIDKVPLKSGAMNALVRHLTLPYNYLIYSLNRVQIKAFEVGFKGVSCIPRSNWGKDK